jgi:hypothetical protein
MTTQLSTHQKTDYLLLFLNSFSMNLVRRFLGIEEMGRKGA